MIISSTHCWYTAEELIVFNCFHDCSYKEAEQGAETAIDPGGGDLSDDLPTTYEVIDAGGEPPPTDEFELHTPPPELLANEDEDEVEEDTMSRRWSLEATAGVSQDEEEELMHSGEGGSVDSETFATDTNTDQGKILVCSKFKEKNLEIWNPAQLEYRISLL